MVMDLDTYLSEKKLTDAAFADEVGVGRSMITKLRNKTAIPSATTARKIEMLTEQAVTLADLIPASKTADVPRPAKEGHCA